MELDLFAVELELLEEVLALFEEEEEVLLVEVVLLDDELELLLDAVWELCFDKLKPLPFQTKVPWVVLEVLWKNTSISLPFFGKA